VRLLHLADLHLGRSLAEFSLQDLQQEFLNEILKTVSERNIDAVMIAGDVYDRSLPPVYAVRMLNDFLCALSEMRVPVLIVSGNHDSAERLSFLSGVLNTSGIYIAGEYDMDAPPVTLSDEFGKINFYLLPFFRPGAVRAQAKDEAIATYNDAVRYAVEKMGVQTNERNVLISHHFVTSAGHAPVQSDSEIMFIGGLEMVDSACFDEFDYVALGHLHQVQKVGRDAVRYAGSPIKYSLSEVEGKKSFVIIEMGEKGDVNIELVPIRLSQDMRLVRGTLEEIMKRPADGADNDFLAVVLTDVEPVYDAMQTLRTRYPYVISVRRERDMIAASVDSISVGQVRELDPFTLFERFYESRTTLELTENEKADIRQALDEATEEATA